MAKKAPIRKARCAIQIYCNQRQWIDHASDKVEVRCTYAQVKSTHGGHPSELKTGAQHRRERLHLRLQEQAKRQREASRFHHDGAVLSAAIAANLEQVEGRVSLCLTVTDEHLHRIEGLGGTDACEVAAASATDAIDVIAAGDFLHHAARQRADGDGGVLRGACRPAEDDAGQSTRRKDNARLRSGANRRTLPRGGTVNDQIGSAGRIAIACGIGVADAARGAARVDLGRHRRIDSLETLARGVSAVVNGIGVVRCRFFNNGNLVSRVLRRLIIPAHIPVLVDASGKWCQQCHGNKSSGEGEKRFHVVVPVVGALSTRYLTT